MPDQDTLDKQGLPERVTMPLLALITQQSVDEDYADVAARRKSRKERPPRPPRWGGRHRGALVVIAIFGVLIATAAVQTSRNADVDSASREALISRIDARKESVSALQDRILELREQNNDLVDLSARLAEAQADAEDAMEALQVDTGFIAVTGPGVRVLVDDEPSGDPEGRVRATDLRLLVNGFWQVGAEAIAINGRRLTAVSAIVNSGVAVQVNRVPLTPPYVVQAIGDVRTMQADLLGTTSGDAFQALADQYGFVVQRQNVDSMDLPSAPAMLKRLRFAEPPPTDDPEIQEGNAS
jgi:uncharacterized protein YlxW (UPF0749 family)